MSKNNTNLAGYGIQTEIIFDVEIEKEINGIPYLTQTGLAKLCGVARGTIYNVGQEIYSATEGKPKERVDKIKELLKTQEYEEKDLFIRIKKSESEI